MFSNKIRVWAAILIAAGIALLCTAVFAETAADITSSCKFNAGSGRKSFAKCRDRDYKGPGGAALATVIGQAVSFLFALRLLYRNRAQIHFDFHPRHFRISRNVIRPLLSLGIPMVIQSAAITFSMLFVNSYIGLTSP